MTGQRRFLDTGRLLLLGRVAVGTRRLLSALVLPSPALRVGYTLTKPVLPLLLFPRYILTTEEIGRAMIHVAKRGTPQRVLESSDIGDFARSPVSSK